MMKRNEFKELRRVWSRGGREAGKPTGRTRLCCQIEGCTGLQIEVKWPKWRNSWPCSKGMGFSPGGRVGYIL